MGGSKGAKAQRRKTAACKSRVAPNAIPLAPYSPPPRKTTVVQFTRELNEAYLIAGILSWANFKTLSASRQRRNTLAARPILAGGSM